MLYLVLLVALALIMAADIAAGQDYSLAFFYGLPVGAAAWYVGRRAGVSFSILAALGIVLSEIEAGYHYRGTLPAGWAVVTAFLSLLVLVHLLSMLANRLETEHRLARADELTGVLNERAFDEELTYLLALHGREKKPLSLAYIDLDDFKDINDRHGHPEGDQTLRDIAAAMRIFSRRTDKVARLGGDEFAVILPDTSEEGAMHILSRIRAGFQSSQSSDRPAVTGSIGCVTFLTPPASVDEAVRAADKLMYEVKHNGKNWTLCRTLP